MSLKLLDRADAQVVDVVVEQEARLDGRAELSARQVELPVLDAAQPLGELGRGLGAEGRLALGGVTGVAGVHGHDLHGDLHGAMSREARPA